MTQKQTENAIRDHLAANLDLIEPGLVLIDKEVMLRNDKGAKGFLDIFCRTADGKYLIIEVKRSDAAAREAVQELVKYAVLLRQKLLVKDTEVRLMVASSEWHELLVPFSEFVRRAPYDCTGVLLELGTDGLAASAKLVALAPEDKPRRLSRRHFIWGYENDARAKAAASIIADHMRAVGLQDFVLLVLAINNHDDPSTRFLYFAQQELSLERYMDLIRSRFPAEAVADFEEWIGDMSELEDKVSEAADKVWEETSDEDSIYLNTDAIHAEIAYPEKARVWFEPKTLVSAEVLRFGRFDDENITDKIIIEEILGDDGVSFHHGDVTARVASKTEMAALLTTADHLFSINSTWRTAVHDLCNYATKTSADAVRMRAFSNDDILRTVACIAIGYPSYAPYFEFEIRRGDDIERIFGIIQWDGRKPNFDHILKEYFEGDSFQYFTPHHFGEHRALNADLMAEMGLSYELGRLEGDGITPIRVKLSCVEDVRGPKRQFLLAFPNGNSEFMNDLIDLFLKHEQHFIKLYEQASFVALEAKLDQFKSVNDRTEPTYWSGLVDQCDVCKRDMASARFMIDSAVVPAGPWGCMCAECFDRTGGRIAWGSGQLYEKDAIGWRLVGGGGPSA